MGYQLKPKSVLEFGGGLGTTSDFLVRFAEADAVCIEPDESLAKLVATVHPSTRQGGVYGGGMMHMLAANVLDQGSKACTDSLTARKFDLVISFEVLEHIPRKHHPAITKFLAASIGKWMVFSAARPKQIGTGHFDESMLTHDEWVEAFKAEGLIYMPKLTQMSIRSGWYPRAYDFGTNLMVFKNAEHDAEDTSEPDDMLKYYWQGNQGVIPQPNVGNKIWELSSNFQSGVEASLWPELDQLSKQIKQGVVPC